MATVSAVRDAIQSRLSTILRVHDTIPGGEIHPPAAVIFPERGQPRTLGPLKQTQEYRLRIAVSAASERTGQDLLDGYLSDTGTSSIRAALATQPTSLGVAGIKAWMSGWENYGLVEISESVYFGVDILITVEN